MLERPLACAASSISAAPCAPETAGATRGLWGGAVVGAGFRRVRGNAEDKTRNPAAFLPVSVAGEDANAKRPV